MKVNAKIETASGQDSERKRRLLRIVQQPSARDLRPCPGCNKHCRRHQSSVCACECGPRCAQAPSQLSSDPIRFPVEPNILSLVLEIAALRVCQPLWSCEGHLDQDNRLTKLPAVWFYVDDLAVVDVFTRFLNHANLKLGLHTHWHLVVSFGGNDMAFSCTPNAWVMPKGIRLQALQQDAHSLSLALRDGLHAQAQIQASNL